MASALASLLLAVFATAASGATLTVASQTLQVDGRPVFVVGVSLFDALGSTAPRDQDLDALKTWGVNLVRVWAHWHEPIYRHDPDSTSENRPGVRSSSAPRQA